MAGKFKKGKSGNPTGRPKGSRNRATILAEAILDGEAEELTRIAIKAAKGGDSTALRLCMERIMPPRKMRPILVKVLPINESGDIISCINTILQATVSGAITTDEADGILRIVDVARKTFETDGMQRELDVLQARLELLDG